MWIRSTVGNDVRWVNLRQVDCIRVAPNLGQWHVVAVAGDDAHVISSLFVTEPEAQAEMDTIVQSFALQDRS